jgi:hypothetical protein
MLPSRHSDAERKNPAPVDRAKHSTTESALVLIGSLIAVSMRHRLVSADFAGEPFANPE